MLVDAKAMVAVELLEQVVDKPNAVIYCDPPYPGTKAPGLHGQNLPKFNAEEMCSVLVDAKAMVAVSGLADSGYDLLGWHRSELAITNTLTFTPGSSRRVEVLWTNYYPHVADRLFK